MTGIIEFSTDTLNIEVSGINNTPVDIVEVISTGQDVYVNVESNYGPVLAVNGRVGFINLDKSDVGLSNVENISITGVSGYLQYQIDNLDTGYASQAEINLLSGLLAQTGASLYTTITNLSGAVVAGYATKIELNNTGSFLYNLINSLSGYGNSTFATITNLASTGQSLQNQINNLDINYASQTEFNNLSGNLISTGANLQSQINSLYGSGFLTGVDLSPYYLKSNPSGFITGVDLSNYASLNDLASTGQNLQNQIDNLDNIYATDLSLLQTGQFLDQKIDAFSGTYQNFVNNLDSNYASQSEFNTLSGNLNSTGQNLNNKINSLSGAAVLTYGDQYIDGQKIFRGEVRIKDLYVTGTETIVNTINTNVASNYLLLNATGGAIDAGIFIVTGLSSGASGMPLTGANNIGAVIGYDVPANRWVFGNTSRDSDLSQLEKIAGITDITNYSGFVSNNFYPLSNPSGFITGVDLSQYLTGVDLSQYVTKISGEFFDRPTVNGTGVLLSGEAAGTANFRYAPVTGVYNLLSNNRYSFDTLTGFVTGILPANPQKGDEIELYDSAGTWHLNPLIVDNNGNYIEQKKDQLQCNVRHGLIKLIYTTQNNIGWRIYPMPIHNVPLFLSPSIAITGAALSGIIPFYIALTGISLLDPAQAPVDEWYWNLNTGDGYAVSGQTIAYTYLQTGYYDVTLSGSNAAGFDVEHRFINVFLPYLPTVNVTANKLSGIIPLSVIFNATNTTQPAEYSPVNEWQWDPDNDGIIDASGGAASTFYTFNNTGIYNSTAYAINLGGTGSGSVFINAFLPYLPNINITTNILSGIIPLYVSFSGQNITQPAEYSPLDYIEWDVNNDNIIDFTGITGSFVYSQTGLFNATSYASNLGGTGINSISINAFLPYLPTVSVTTSRLSGLAPFTGILTGTNTTQPAEYSPVDNWYWDFDGDQVFDFTGQNATVVYNQTGTYSPTAYAINLGGTGTGFITINVIEPLVPIPAIATYTASGFAPLTIQFSGVNLQTPEEFSPVDHWYWNLSGDSAPEFDQRVISYTFNETGTYTFYLTAANSAGSGVASGIVTIFEPPIIPVPISGLLVRFNADAGVNDSNGTITSWTDQQSGVVATAFNGPTLLTNQLNGRKAVSFDGANDHFTFTLPTPVLNGAKRTFVIIGKYNNPGSTPQQGYLNSTARDLCYVFKNGGENRSYYYTESRQIQGPAVSLANYHIMTVVHNGVIGANFIRINGTTSTNIDYGVMNNLPQLTDIVIGGRTPGSEPLYGEIVELLIYNRELTTQEIEQLEEYADI